MPNAVFVTWLQLRSLTWCGQKIPPFSVQEWVDLTGTSRTTLIRHLNWLQKLNALRWHSPEPGTVSVSFEEAPHSPHTGHEGSLEATKLPIMDCSKMDRPKMDSPNLDSPPSLNPHSSSSQILVLEPGNQEPDQIMRNEVKGGGERDLPAVSSRFHCEGENGSPNLNSSTPANAPTLTPDPVSAYRSLAHLTPNASQRRILISTVTDLPLWQRTLEHWLTHGWNPRNLTGMLELYGRGGPSGCRYCHQQHREAKTAQEHTHEALEGLRRELGIPSQPSDP